MFRRTTVPPSPKFHLDISFSSRLPVLATLKMLPSQTCLEKAVNDVNHEVASGRQSLTEILEAKPAN